MIVSRQEIFYSKIEVELIESTALHPSSMKTLTRHTWICMCAPQTKTVNRNFGWTSFPIVSNWIIISLQKIFFHFPHLTVMLASVPFLMVTFLVYVSLPELRNLHGKCLLGYLICMAIGYSCLGWVKINGENYVEPLLCQSLGYLIYFSFISAFLWSNVISADLWWNFQ